LAAAHANAQKASSPVKEEQSAMVMPKKPSTVRRKNVLSIVSGMSGKRGAPAIRVVARVRAAEKEKCELL